MKRFFGDFPLKGSCTTWLFVTIEQISDTTRPPISALTMRYMHEHGPAAVRYTSQTCMQCMHDSATHFLLITPTLMMNERQICTQTSARDYFRSLTTHLLAARSIDLDQQRRQS